MVTKRPEGLRSHSTGTRPRMVSKSSMVRGTSAAWAMARRCSTALVEPPSAMTTAMAFSKALRVRIWRAVRPAAMASARTRAEVFVLSAFSASMADIVDEPGRLIPMASMAEDMVLAVNIPPQAPAPGQAVFSISMSSSRGSLPATCWPRASKTLTMVRSRPAWCPGLMVPP